jgi:uncharacterized protein (TIGR03435 family)
MDRSSRIALAILSMLSAALAQEPKPAFEAVDVHPATPDAQMVGGRFRPGTRFEASGYTMMDLISKAYGLPWDRILGGPPWLGSEKFDVIAIVPASVPANSGTAMIQAVLAERFKLVVHHDTRPIRVFDLLPGKRPVLKVATGGESQCKYSRPESFIAIACTNMAMDQFVKELTNYAQEYLDRPLLDKTELTGRYDFNLQWTPLDQRKLRSADGEMTGVSLQDALDKQLGLKIEVRPEPMPVIVVDSVNRVPTPNAPGVTAAVNAPAYAEFEVAEVRPHKPGTPFKYNDTETLSEYMGFTLPSLINMAWNTPPQKRQVIGGPAWIKTELFDVIAKPGKRVPWENIQLMLRNLYIQQFHLRIHEEQQPTVVYALTVGKRTAKLKDAEPGRRSECRKTLGDGNVTLTCQNTTIKQLEERSRSEAWGMLDHPVLDMTGLTSPFDFAVTWVPGPRIQQPKTEDAAAGGVATTPTGEITFFEALEKQLGLKLVRQTQPYPVLVIDSAERPAEK